EVAADAVNDPVPEEELICTLRGDEPDGPAVTNGAPDGSVQNVNGSGRGPTTAPALVCAACNETCAPCQCPVNQTDGDVAIAGDPSGDMTNTEIRELLVEFGAPLPLECGAGNASFTRCDQVSTAIHVP